MPDTREIQELKLDVGLLKRDINQTNKLLEKLSISIDKIQELKTYNELADDIINVDDFSQEEVDQLR